MLQRVYCIYILLVGVLWWEGGHSCRMATHSVAGAAWLGQVILLLLSLPDTDGGSTAASLAMRAAATSAMAMATPNATSPDLLITMVSPSLYNNT